MPYAIHQKQTGDDTLPWERGPLVTMVSSLEEVDEWMLVGERYLTHEHVSASQEEYDAWAKQSRYWDGSGRFQSMCEQVKGLIPRVGSAPEATLEALRRVSQCYYDTYNNGGCNGFLYADALPVLEQSDLSDGDKSVLRRMFTAASDDRLEIQFDGRPDPADEDDINPEDEDELWWVRHRVLIKEAEFSQPLERLADWATKRAWLQHCA